MKGYKHLMKSLHQAEVLISVFYKIEVRQLEDKTYVCFAILTNGTIEAWSKGVDIVSEDFKNSTKHICTFFKYR